MLDQLTDRSSGPDECWPWTGGSLVGGYGVLYTLGTAKTRRMVKAHRLAYEIAHDGECPPTIDHTCHDGAECKLASLCPHRRCCNPAHLKAETAAGNASRAQAGIYEETCRAGHRMNGDNAYEAPDGSRYCRKCAAARARNARSDAKRGREKAATEIQRPRGLPAAEAVAWALDGQDSQGCMRWPGSTPNGSGYVYVGVGGKTIAAHRLVYAVRVAPIPDGYMVDHTCHDPKICPGGMECAHRACINPEHLTAVTHAENSSVPRSVRRRPDECIAGHLFTEENTYTDKQGSRHCLACQRDHAQAAAGKARESSGWTDARFRDGNLCRNGHDVTVTGLNAEGKCAECSRTRKREWKAREAAKPKPDRVDKRKRQGDLCGNGLHDVTVTGLTKAGRCAECKRASQRLAPVS
ncbi:MAG TPA: HNH endonuclease signature motif containing protein [Trebonia sp.]